MNEQELYIESLEANFTDPELDSLIQNACFVSDVFADPGTTEADAIEAATDLQDEFRHLKIKGEQVFVTSSGWLVSSGDTDSAGNLTLHNSSRMNFVDQEVHLSDFVIHEFTDITDDGVTTKRGLYLYGRTPIVETNKRGKAKDMTIEECVINISPDMIIRREGPTPDTARAWLDMYFPDEYESIFERCVNADDEAGLLLNLKDYTVDTTDLSSEIATQLAENIEVYLKGQVNLAGDLPYIVKVSGEIQRLSSAEYMFADLNIKNTTSEKFMYLHDILCTYDIETNIIRTWIEGAFVKPGGTGRVAYRVPMISFDSIASIRDYLD